MQCCKFKREFILEIYQRAEVLLSNECLLVDGKLISDKNLIRNIWADHFESLGTISSNTNFDSKFLAKVADTVQELFVSFTDDPRGTLKSLLSMRKLRTSAPNWKWGFQGLMLTMNIFVLQAYPYGNFYWSCTRIFSLTPQSLNLYWRVLSYHFLRARVQELITKIIIGELP